MNKEKILKSIENFLNLFSRISKANLFGAFIGHFFVAYYTGQTIFQTGLALSLASFLFTPSILLASSILGGIALSIASFVIYFALKIIMASLMNSLVFYSYKGSFDKFKDLMSLFDTKLTESGLFEKVNHFSFIIYFLINISILTQTPSLAIIFWQAILPITILENVIMFPALLYLMIDKLELELNQTEINSNEHNLNQNALEFELEPQLNSKNQKGYIDVFAEMDHEEALNKDINNGIVARSLEFLSIQEKEESILPLNHAFKDIVEPEINAHKQSISFVPRHI